MGVSVKSVRVRGARAGASGCVIERAAADRLGLAEFGELYVAGMAGRLRSRFRRARTLRLGPLTLRDPLFMCVLSAAGCSPTAPCLLWLTRLCCARLLPSQAVDAVSYPEHAQRCPRDLKVT